MSTSRSGTVAVPFLKKNLAMWNVTNFKVTDTPHCTATFTIPGLSHESFDIDGNPKITSIMLTSVLSRAYALHKPDAEAGTEFLDWPKAMSDRYTFVSSTEFRISQNLYKPDIPKWPLDVKFSLGNVGNSSIANVIEFYPHGQDAEPLWTNVTQVVSIDTATRKPSLLPEWFKDKYKGKGCLEKSFIIKTFERPAVTFCQSVKVNWSDTDNFKHTNFASYVRFALDCLHAAIRDQMLKAAKNHRKAEKEEAQKPNGHEEHEAANGNDEVVIGDGQDTSDQPLQGIDKDKISNGLKNVQICYQNESLESQVLDTHVWQREGEPYVIWCAIERDSKGICQIRLEYFDTQRE